MSSQVNRFNPFAEEDNGASYAYAFGRVLVFVTKALWLLLLFVLLSSSFVVWIWIAAFRSGWHFWSWVDSQSSNQSALALNLVYGLIILFISPIILFAGWTQRLLKQWLNVSLPFTVDLRKIIEEQLGVKLGDGFPFLTAATPDNTVPQLSAAQPK